MIKFAAIMLVIIVLHFWAFIISKISGASFGDMVASVALAAGVLAFVEGRK